MKKPYVLAVDDDLSVLHAVERDLKSRFAADYRILAIDSPQKAVDTVRQLAARGDRVALFLAEVMPLQPEAKCVLLPAYADSSAAIDAINKVKLSQYLMKPWEPPDRNLYPVLADQLEDWRAGNPSVFEGVYVIGTRWSPDTHLLRDFLAKSQVP